MKTGYRKSSSNIPLKSSIRHFLQKCRVGLHKISREALDSDSAEESSNVNGLFEADPKRQGLRERVSEERNSSTSVTLTRELRLTDEEDDELEPDSMDNSENDPSAKELQTFATYDAVQECAKLRSKVGEPFAQGDQIWQRRRELWVKPTEDAQPKLAERNREKFNEIAPRHYARIYRKLVVESIALKRSLNLQDAIKVINAGWVETQKWERAANGLA
ncbi:LANO_0G11826g1_1 [Lachancea nothofagi CBS 11611]|uniref:LANO_0G11826g1_1 n=1 Tax=Lachancea nothofagi CBS 11611 TaxID=1266666 RepID=A0A1G4KJG5_9SACH|nr:LANO_0G11826g1_1 [Lachancea nothofagi CBS 11611]